MNESYLALTPRRLSGPWRMYLLSRWFFSFSTSESSCRSSHSPGKVRPDHKDTSREYGKSSGARAIVCQDLENTRFNDLSGQVRPASAKAQYHALILILSINFVVILALDAAYYLGRARVMAETGSFLGKVTAIVKYTFLVVMPLLSSEQTFPPYRPHVPPS